MHKTRKTVPPSVSARVLRRISEVTLLLTVALRLVLRGRMEPCQIASDLCCACTVLLLSPGSFGDWRNTLLLAVLTVTGALILAGTAHLIQPPAVPVAYLCATLVPLLVSQTGKGYAMLHDLDFLTVGLSGWDIAKGFLRQLLLLYYIALIALTEVLAARGLVRFQFGRWVACAVHVGTYLLLVVRSVTEKPILRGLDRFRPAMMRSSPPKMDAQSRMLFTRLCKYMDERKPFLNPNLKLEQVAGELYTNRGYLSRLINACTGMSFNHFINGYRIRYATELFRENTLLKVADLYPLCGFNNKGPFNVAFRLFMNTTPRQWCEAFRDSQEGISPSSPPAGGRQPPPASSG